MNKEYAFWKCDLFPYVLSGEVSAKRVDGTVEIKSYGRGYLFEPLIVLPLEDGLKLQAKINVIANERDNLIKRINKSFEVELKGIAPFIK